jgi:4-amino-4-deoxy-L-arabinose transferase-like glycosyltransferase
VRFWDALLERKMAQTYQRHHPGVTVMWIAGFGLRICMIKHGWSSNDLLNPPSQLSGPQGPLTRSGVAALALVISVCTALAYLLLNRLVSWPVAFSGGCFLALDPFHIAHSKLIHVDGLLAILMLVSALFLINNLQEGKLIYLVFSGVFAGLSFLTKSPSIFLVPYASLIVALHHLVCSDKVAIVHRLWGALRILLIWGFIAIFIFFLLWPAMWVMPGETLFKITRNAHKHTITPHPNPNFFAGRVVNDPGPLYYMAVLLWKTTMVTLLCIGVAVYFLVRWRKCKDKCLWYIVIYAAGFLLMMTLGNKKWARYILPVFTALDILAGWGLVQMANSVAKLDRLRRRVWAPSIVGAVALVVQAIVVMGYHPYYGTHHNLLLGGSQAAQHILALGNLGEGLDLAANFLNSYPDAETIQVGTQNPQNRMLRSNFVGQVRDISDSDVDYWIFYINRNQRNLYTPSSGHLWEICQQKEPVWSVSFDGVTYVWIYKSCPVDR